MVSLLYCLSDIVFAVILLIILFSSMKRTRHNSADRAYYRLVKWIVWFCLQDAVWGFAASGYFFKSRELFFGSSFVFHLSTAVTVYLWLNYVLTFLEDRVKHKKAIQAAAGVIVCMQVSFLLINFKYPLFFYVDENVCYQTGILRTISFVLQHAAYIAIGLIALITYLREKNSEREKYKTVVWFVSAPAVCGGLQFFIPIAPYHAIGYVLGCCIIHEMIIIGEQRELLEIKATELQDMVDNMTVDLRQAKEDAESAYRAKTSFLFNMSHDIRTPMNAIIGYTDLLQERDIDEYTRRDYIEKIRGSSIFLLEIINNTLEMSKIDSGKVILDENVLNVEQIGSAVDSVFEEQLEKKNIHYKRIVNVEHENIIGDDTKIKEIFMNLLSNAMKYTAEGGDVSFTVKELPTEDEDVILIKTVVEDTGIGMSEEFLPHLFEEFEREQNTTLSKIGGTGLGMAITKKLVELMKGTIEVESELGKGTKVTVVIPHRIAEVSGIKEVVEEEKSCKTTLFRGRRVLLAEDNDLNAEIAQAILMKSGFEVEHAQDGVVCVDMLQKAENGYYDLILMDIQMPNLNGYLATRKIRNLTDERKDIPIIAMTANAFEEDKKNAIEAGMDGHISKPIDVSKMLKTIQEVLEK